MVVNIWFAIIGVFVYLGASNEETATLAHLHLAGRRVRDVDARAADHASTHP